MKSRSSVSRSMNKGDQFKPDMERIENAFVAPQTYYDKPSGEYRPIYDGGVYYANGLVCDLARHIATSTENVPSAVDLEPVRTLKGNFLYGGVMRGHFGHFLVESIGRLWALDQIDHKVDGIIYAPLHHFRSAPIRHPNETYKVKSYITNFLKLIGVDVPLYFPSDVWQISELHVPSQLMMNSPWSGIEGHPVLHSFFKDRFERHFKKAVNPHRSIYLSRKLVPLINSVFLQEEVVEKNLLDNGFEIIYPELMSIEKQVELYRESKNILIAEGSSAHLVALTAHEAQNIGIISRYKMRRSPGKFERQIRAFGCSSCRAFDVVSEMYSANDLCEGLNIPAVVSTIDFNRLGSMLASAGFVDINKWYSPTQKEITEAVNDASTIFREEIMFPLIVMSQKF